MNQSNRNIKQKENKKMASREGEEEEHTAGKRVSSFFLMASDSGHQKNAKKNPVRVRIESDPYLLHQEQKTHFESRGDCNGKSEIFALFLSLCFEEEAIFVLLVLIFSVLFVLAFSQFSGDFDFVTFFSTYRGHGFIRPTDSAILLLTDLRPADR